MHQKELSKLVAIILNSTLIPKTYYLEKIEPKPRTYVRGILPRMLRMSDSVGTHSIHGLTSGDLRRYFKSRLIRLPILHRKMGDIFSELGASSFEQASLENVKPDRRELDKIIMEDVLWLTEEEQLEVYKAVIDLVKSRIEKAKSVNKSKRTKNGINLGALKNSVIEHIKREA